MTDGHGWGGHREGGKSLLEGGMQSTYHKIAKLNRASVKVCILIYCGLFLIVELFIGKIKELHIAT